MQFPGFLIFLDDLDPSGDLDLWPRITKIFLCTPWNIIYHLCKFEVIAFVGLGGVCEHTHRQTHRRS